VNGCVDTDRESVATAYHEAGHAAVTAWFGLRLERVELTPDHPVHAGCCREQVDDPHALSRALELGDERVIRPQIKILLAGRAAQQKGGFDHVPDCDRQDVETALKVASLLVGCASRAEQLLAESLVETQKLLDHPAVWAGVEALANELLLKGAVAGDEAHRILDRAGNGRPASPAWNASNTTPANLGLPTGASQ
jgi:hypothetical protein